MAWNRSRRALPILALFSSFAIVLEGRGQDAPDDRPLEERKRAALKRGADWLKRQQGKDGLYDYLDAPFELGIGEHLRQGATALAAFALLKSGTPPEDPVVKKAFSAMAAQPVKYSYSAGCVLLALEAMASWTPIEDATGDSGKAAGKPRRKLDAPLMELAKKCSTFLVSSQHEGVWRYEADSAGQDVSCAQYALLGLDAAERLEIAVPKEAYRKALEHLVANQESSGPDVELFRVPGAELSFPELRSIASELQDKIRKIEKRFQGKKPGEADASGHFAEDERRVAEEEAGKRMTGTRSGPVPTMQARGWRYMVDDEKPHAVTGSMTASGLACLFLCKAHLDTGPEYEPGRARVDKALRDGAAWLAKNFAVDHNTDAKRHHYYYLYSLERAGILGLIPKFGEHDWYDEGVRFLVGKQRGDGMWDAGDSGTSGPVPDTCFALLFIARGTTPPVRLPERVMTGPPAK